MSKLFVSGSKSISTLSEDFISVLKEAVENGVTVFTSLDTVNVLLNILEEITMQVSLIDD